MRRLDLIGKILETGAIIVSPAGISSNGKSKWRCKCFCGKEFIALGSELLNGHTRSCGCYSRSGVFTSTHGYRRVNGKQPPIYTLWVNMKNRCLHHPEYAGRGIAVCARWQESFENFLVDIQSTLGPMPPIVKGYKRYWSLDRINNNGNYEIGNVRWANPTQQKLNQRLRRWWKRPKEATE
jgi:hypothetical protein